MTLEVLVATMRQEDFSLHKRMNLRTNAVIANQCGKWELKEQMQDFGRLRMISSQTRGVGVNRNLALTLAEADILLFADDDIVYYDSDLQGVIDAFRELPDADVIFFGVDLTRNGMVFEHRHSSVRRTYLWNSLKYGTYRIAIRRRALQKSNIWFSPLFGGGCRYGSGEDTLFILDCFRAGLKAYSHSYVLGACAKDTSTWFSGFNEKYMFDKGAWVACAFPKIKHLMKWYFIWRFSKKTELPLPVVIRQFNAGIRAFGELKTFEDAEKTV